MRNLNIAATAAGERPAIENIDPKEYERRKDTPFKCMIEGAWS